MKKSILCLCATSFLGSCATSPGLNWNEDCDSNYSLTNRERSNCLKKVEDNRSLDIDAGTISIDPNNPDREGFEDAGKSGAHNPDALS